MEYTIAQVSDLLGCKPYLLRFFESEFALDIPRKENNRRYYTDHEIALFQRINEMKNSGMSNKDIKEEILLWEKDNDQGLRVELMEYSSEEKTHEQITSGGDYQYLVSLVKTMKEEMDILRASYVFKEKDELISENARLKLKLKEKTYELITLKEKYDALMKSKKRNIFYYEK